MFSIGMQMYNKGHRDSAGNGPHQTAPRCQLGLVYQPQKNIRTDEVVGFEASPRWEYPPGGRISPAAFIRLAEESGTIPQIRDWVLRMACIEAARWKRVLTVSVDISSRQLQDFSFPYQVEEILAETGLPPYRLELQVAMTAIIRDRERALSTVRRLKAVQIKVAIDDFGAGYPLLLDLRPFPFSKLKIDRSFIKSVDTDGETASVVRTLIGVGRVLGVRVLADGVETLRELEFLSRELCDEVQGDLLGLTASIEHFSYLTDE
jgi:EAL domain-containing protein (putative c-di-GMP-specific phosphodiesterase class I)